MPSRLWTIQLAGAAGILGIALATSADPMQAEQNQAKPNANESEGNKQDRAISAAEARRQAKLMHQIYASTLDNLHHHFFRRDRAVLPARAMEDIFADMEKETNIKAKWISVNTKAMSIHHEPKGDFEKKAAEAIAAGKDSYERIEDGHFNRATAIPLGSSCISCHTGFFSNRPATARFAGLVIRVPIKKEQ